MNGCDGKMCLNENGLEPCDALVSVWRVPGKLAEIPECYAGPTNWACTLPKGHEGPHIACSPITHNLAIWSFDSRACMVSGKRAGAGEPSDTP